MTDGTGTTKSSSEQASGGQTQYGASGAKDNAETQRTPTAATSPQRPEEPRPAARRQSLYERIRYDLQHDQKVNQEVRLGKRVGFYKLKGHLGTGNFSKVKLGVHLLTTGKKSSLLRLVQLVQESHSFCDTTDFSLIY